MRSHDRHFCHLHCHTDYSLLDGASQIPKLVAQAKKKGMRALAITDHGNLYGVPSFIDHCQRAGIKPIIGCEFYMAPKGHRDRSDKTRYHQLLIAKNREGYQNLIKLSSISYTRGYYYKPRIDFELLKKYRNGLIATSCCLGAEIPQTILGKDINPQKKSIDSIDQAGVQRAEERLRAWHKLFQEDFYIELQDQGITNKAGVSIQKEINAILLAWAKKYEIKVIATNDVHYVEQADAQAQDIMLCLQTGKKVSDTDRMRFENDQFYLKSPEEMGHLFKDPYFQDALTNTGYIADQIDDQLAGAISHVKPIFPDFPIPPNYPDAAAYMRALALQGAQQMHGRLVPKEVLERIEKEALIIEKMGFADYFLIVQDLVRAVQKQGVYVGPGRGSVAGSAIAYYLGITEIDPLQYNLLFERFLNPERVTMPDIDLDFDDKGREKVISYVKQMYPNNQVAQIVTFGRMGAKSSIRDVARVLDYPLREANRLAKWVPNKPGFSLKQALKEVPELAEAYKAAPSQPVLEAALQLNGAVRQSGIHAAGVIIGPGDLTNYIPVKIDPKSAPAPKNKMASRDLAPPTPALITQFDGKYIEQYGMLKMDFLGLKTLSILHTVQTLIKEKQGITIDLKKIPLDTTGEDPAADEQVKKTYQLFQAGDTVGVFQFESAGMQKWLQRLKPNQFEDLIAMNALYRPGPMQFIPNYIDRKQGKEPVTYPHPLLEKWLKNSFGIMVYQEQVMQAAQEIAGYSLGEADILRRAMGKKKVEVMARQKKKFIAGALAQHKIDAKSSEHIFNMMEKFAQYGFPRAHATAYARIAYQTAYLKANYPVEYMAGVLQHNQQDISKITFFIEECKRLNIQVLGPDINESDTYFTPCRDRSIRFGLSAIKGIGTGISEEIIEERRKAATFKGFVDFYKRMKHTKLNKTVLENLVYAGAFDNTTVKYDRKQYIVAHPFTDAKGKTYEESYIEHLIRLFRKWKPHQPGGHPSTGQMGLFLSLPLAVPSGPKVPPPPSVEAYAPIEKLQKEREVVGFYINGHPLDHWKTTQKHFCSVQSDQLLSKEQKNATFAAILTSCTPKMSKSGKRYAELVLEDQKGAIHAMLWAEQYLKFKPLLEAGNLLYIRADIRNRYPGAETPTLYIQAMELLEEVMDRYADRLVIRLTAAKCTDYDWTNLANFLEKKQEKKDTESGVPVALEILDGSSMPAIQLLVQGMRIDLSSNFLDDLTASYPADKVRYRLQKKRGAPTY